MAAFTGAPDAELTVCPGNYSPCQLLELQSIAYRTKSTHYFAATGNGRTTADGYWNYIATVQAVRL